MKTFSLFELSRRQSHPVRGLSLIELLVSMAIGLIVTLAIATVMVRSEGQKRTSTVLNDASQTGAYASLTLDRALRSAGSGFTQFRTAMGCFLNASIGSGATQILPPTVALPAPFAAIGTAAVPIRLAPVVIVDGGQVSGVDQPDQLIVMSGTHGFSETPVAISPGSIGVFSMNLLTTLGFASGDLILVTSNQAGETCMVQQVGAVVAGSQTLPLAGAYFDATGVTAVGTIFDVTEFNVLPRASVLPIGSIPAAGPVNPPLFFAYGVDVTTDSLMSYDLLNTTGAPLSMVSEGVVSMQALYGVGTATAPAGTPAAAVTPLVWTAPTGPLYTASSASLLSPAGAQTNLPTIQAIRVSLVIRSPLQEKEDVAPDTLVLFPDLAGLQVNFPISPAQQKFRHRVVDFVVPIRNL